MLPAFLVVEFGSAACMKRGFVSSGLLPIAHANGCLHGGEVSCDSVGERGEKQRIDGRAPERGKIMEQLGRNREETIILFS